MILSTTVTEPCTAPRDVSESSVRGWIADWQRDGFTEGRRQHDAQVRHEAEQLRKKAELARVDKIGVDVQAALVDLIESNPVAYGRELQKLLRHVTGVWLELDDIWVLRKQMHFSCCRLGRPMRAADPILQNAYKTRWAAHQIEDWQCIWIDVRAPG
jgi:transposase